LCCNPNHLAIGDHQDNMRDMVESGRSLKGERNNKAKLTRREVELIRARRRDGALLREIQIEFSHVSLATVGLVCQQKIWR
jgi:hypothetical protein